MTNDEFDKYPFWTGEAFLISGSNRVLPLIRINSKQRELIFSSEYGEEVRLKAAGVKPLSVNKNKLIAIAGEGSDGPPKSLMDKLAPFQTIPDETQKTKPAPPTTHIMLDLETMGTGPDAAIIAIGAVAFTESGITDEFYGRVSLASSVACGLTIDAETVLWWLKQSDEARAEFAENSQDPNLHVQLVNFFNFATDSGSTQLWGCGAGFDNTIIRTAFKKTNLPFPSALPYTADRCYRTMKAQHPEVEFEREGTHHHALDDAKSQALHLIKIWEHLKNDH